MARPEKTGLDIYPCDVDYYLDDSVAAVTREFGFKAEVIFVRMMCAIYRGGGYYMHWTDQQEMALLKELPGVGRELLRSVVIRLVGYGYFDKRLFDAKRVLTNASIQRRYLTLAKRRKRCDHRYILEGVNVRDNSVNVRDNSVNVRDNSVNVRDNSVNVRDNSVNVRDNSVITGEEKKKVSKEKKEELIALEKRKKESHTNVWDKKEREVSPSGESAKAPKSLDERKRDFYESLVPYLDKYGKEMLREFYDFWSESNEGGTKMRWEIAKTRCGTFSISNRLATWKRNEGRFGRARDGIPERGISISQAIRSAYVPEPGLENIGITRLLE